MLKAKNYFDDPIEEESVDTEPISVAKLDHIGKRYGKWIVLEKLKRSKVKARCDCGFEAIRRIDALYNNGSVQCKNCCLRDRKRERFNRIYGHYGLVKLETIIDSKFE